MPGDGREVGVRNWMRNWIFAWFNIGLCLFWIAVGFPKGFWIAYVVAWLCFLLSIADWRCER